MNNPLVTQSNNRIAIQGPLDFSSVLSAWNQVKQIRWLDSLEFDLSAVTVTSSAALALMVGVARLGRQNKKAVLFKDVPQSLVALARVSRVDEMLNV